MKKQLEMLQHFNLVDESIFLLYQWVNHGDIIEVKGNQQKELEEDSDEEGRKRVVIQKIFYDVRDQLLPKKERIDYYFKERNMEFSTLASLVLLWQVNEKENKLVNFEERFKDITEEEKILEFAGIIGDEELTTEECVQLKTLSGLISFIDSSSYDKEARWDAIKIFNHPKAYYDEVYDIICETMSLLSDRHGEEIAALEEEFYRYWTEFQQDNNVIDLINEKIKVTWETETPTVMQPVLFLPHGIVLTLNDEKKQNNSIIRMGVLIDKNLICEKKDVTSDDVVSIGKLLSDKSKVDILKIISKNPCYGRELAAELNLSTATISYHVNALLKEGFVKADASFNRVYYSIDLERISARLDEVKGFFG